MKLEFWVMRVLLHRGRVGGRRAVRIEDMDAHAAVATLALVSTGDLCCLPDGSIAEPMEVYVSELEAHSARERLRTDRPHEDFRVVLNSAI